MSEETTKVIEKLKDYSAEVHTQLAYAINGYKRKPKGDLYLCCREADLLIDYIQELKKQLEEKEDFINKLQATKDKLNKWDYEKTMQQKEFILYLENEIKSCELVCDLIFNRNKEMKIYKENLSKYIEIIGKDINVSTKGGENEK